MKNTKQRNLIYVTLIVIVILIFVVLHFLNQLNKPSVASSTTYPASKTSSNPINLSPVQLSNAYASFNYPVLLKPVAQTATAPPIVYEQNFTYKSSLSWRMAVVISNQPSGQLSSNSGYEFRLQNPSIYKETSINTKSGPVIIMTDTSTGEFSKVAYLFHGNYQASVALVSDDSPDTNSLSTAFNMVLNSWSWH